MAKEQESPRNAVYYFAMTVTLLPKLFRQDATKQYDNTFGILRDLLRDSVFVKDATIVAELTKSFNVHYHCLIQTFDTIRSEKRLRKLLVDEFRHHPLFGFVCIKLCNDKQGWVNYIIKELDDTKQLLDRRPVIIDENQVIRNNGLDISSYLVDSDDYD